MINNAILTSFQVSAYQRDYCIPILKLGLFYEYFIPIFRPLDLATIKKCIETGAIRNTSEFQRDMMQMFTNAIMYNNLDHDVFHMATEMYDDVMRHIEVWFVTLSTRSFIKYFLRRNNLLLQLILRWITPNRLSKRHFLCTLLSFDIEIFFGDLMLIFRNINWALYWIYTRCRTNIFI
jgi:bromodomain-containing protein 8